MVVQLPEQAQREFFDLFDHIEIRVMSLVALGWTDGDIATRIHGSLQYVKKVQGACRQKTGLGRNGLGLLYVSRLLQFDTDGRYKQPGDKYAAWQADAKRRFAQLQAAGIYPVGFKAVRLMLGDLQHPDLSDDELAKFMPGEPNGMTYRGYVSQVCNALRSIISEDREVAVAAGHTPPPLPRGRTRAISIFYLADTEAS